MAIVPAFFLAEIQPSVLLLLGVAAAWYVAARAGTDALAGGDPTGAPGRRAIAHWMPVVIVAIYAMIKEEAALALSVVFASSVAALSLVLGVITLTTPPSLIAVEARRKWAFVLPVALLALLAGFRGELTLTHALAFTVQGLALLLLWRDRGSSALAAPLPDPEMAIETPSPNSQEVRPAWLPPIEIVLALLLACMAAVGALWGSQNLAGKWNVSSTSIVATLMLGPALVLSMVGSGTLLAHRGQYTAAISMLVGFVLLNLCALLPLLIVVWHVSRGAGATAAAAAPVASAAGYVQSMLANDAPLVYSLSVWRVDTVVLVVLGLFLLPVSIGRWLPGKLEAAALILAFVIYLAMASVAAGGRI